MLCGVVSFEEQSQLFLRSCHDELGARKLENSGRKESATAPTACAIFSVFLGTHAYKTKDSGYKGWQVNTNKQYWLRPIFGVFCDEAGQISRVSVAPKSRVISRVISRVKTSAKTACHAVKRLARGRMLRLRMQGPGHWIAVYETVRTHGMPIFFVVHTCSDVLNDVTVQQARGDMHQHVVAWQPCSACGKTQVQGQQGPMLRCQKCKTAVYCSRGCQCAHWEEHKAQCRDWQVAQYVMKYVAK